MAPQRRCVRTTQQHLGFTVSFENTAIDAGYAPFQDIVVPKGVSVHSATVHGSAADNTSIGYWDAAAVAVEHVSPVTDAESGRVTVRLRVDAAANGMRAGIRCTTDLAPAADAGNRSQ